MKKLQDDEEKDYLPWIEQRADPFVTNEHGGKYYFTASVPEYDRIVLRCADGLDDLATASEKVIWRKHDYGEMVRKQMACCNKQRMQTRMRPVPECIILLLSIDVEPVNINWLSCWRSSTAKRTASHITGAICHSSISLGVDPFNNNDGLVVIILCFCGISFCFFVITSQSKCGSCYAIGYDTPAARKFTQRGKIIEQLI